MTDVFADVLCESKRHNEHKDCAVRAVAVATDYEYDDVHYAFSICGRVPRRGTRWEITEKVVKLLRHRMIDVTHQFKARTVRTLEREMRHHTGRYIVRVNRHLLPVVDGKVHDWSQGRLHRIIAVYRLEETDSDFHRRNDNA
jgi:hypothetical protein